MQLFVWYYYYIGISCLFTHDWYVQWIMKRQMIMNDIRAAVCLVDQWLLCCYYKTTGFSTIGCNKNQLITIIISICFLFTALQVGLYIHDFLYHYPSTNFSVKDKKGKKPFFESQLNANIYKEF